MFFLCYFTFIQIATISFRFASLSNIRFTSGARTQGGAKSHFGVTIETLVAAPLAQYFRRGDFGAGSQGGVWDIKVPSV